MLAVAVAKQIWWFSARSSGVVAWALAAASVIWGLLLSTRLLGKKPPAPWLLDLHRFLGGMSVVFVGIHLSGLAADSYTHFGWSQLFVPFASTWKPLPVAWGIVSFYILIAIEVTSLAKSYIPKKLWRYVHLSSFALYIFSTIHFLTAGTDAHRPNAKYAILASVAIITLLTTYRLLMPARAAKRDARAAALAGLRAQQTGVPVPQSQPRYSIKS